MHTEKRSAQRLPVVTWIHPNGAPLCRSSQPIIGLNDKLCPEDEALLLAYRSTLLAYKHDLNTATERHSAEHRAEQGTWTDNTQYTSHTTNPPLSPTSTHSTGTGAAVKLRILDCRPLMSAQVYIHILSYYEFKDVIYVHYKHILYVHYILYIPTPI